MAELWYYRLLGEEFGPVSEFALRDLLAAGTIGGSDEVRRSHDSRWQRAGEIGWNDTATDSDDAPDLDSLLAGPASAVANRGADSNQTAETAPDDLDGMLAPSAPRRRGTTADEWYYRVSGQRFGPFDFDTLFEHASSGQFSRYDEIRPPGADEWVEAQTIVGLFSDDEVDLDAMLADEQPLPASAAPRPAPVKKQWYYRVLNQQLGPVDFEGLFDLVMEGHLRPDDDIRESDDTQWQRADSLVGLFPDDLSEDTGAPAAVQEEFAEDSEDADWYFKMDDQELGPVTFERLMQLAQSGRLQRSDPIRLTKLGSWMQAESMVGLFPEESPPQEPPPPEEPPSKKPASSLPERPTGDADDWAAAVLSEEQPEPPRRSAPPPTPAEPRTPSAPAPREPEPAPAAAAALSIATKMAATASAQRQTFTPPPKSSRKSSSGGGGFSLPSGLGATLANPALLGGIGVVLLGAALYFFVPWGSLFTPPVDDLTAQLEEIWGQVKPLYENKAPAAEWEALAAKVKPQLAEIAKEATDRGAGPERQMLQIASVLASSSIPKVLEEKTESKATQVKTVDNFLARLKEG